MFLVSSCSSLCPIQWNQVLSREWRCSWSSADRRCSNYIWVIDNFIAYCGASYIRDLTVNSIQWGYKTLQILLMPWRKLSLCVHIISAVTWRGLVSIFVNYLDSVSVHILEHLGVLERFRWNSGWCWLGCSLVLVDGHGPEGRWGLHCDGACVHLGEGKESRRSCSVNKWH